METLFLIGLMAVLSVLFGWCFRALPRERWQIIGSLPTRKRGDGHWEGLNLTYYGLFNALAYTLATAMAFVLLGSLGAPPMGILAIAITFLGICMPASKGIARLVERKKATFTVGGAAFVGIVLGPWIIVGLQQLVGPALQLELPVMAAMAALSISYAFGEGVGRLACISFGCCYGRALEDLPPAWQRTLAPLCFVFEGKTRKIAYASGLDGQRVIPVQAMTALFYTLSGVVGVGLFLQGAYRAAFLETLLLTQLWRFFSEFLRADFRGDRKISAYQIMGLVSCAYAIAVALGFTGAAAGRPALALGLAQLWRPEVLLFFQALAIAVFLYTGRSQVTGARLRFHVRMENI